MPIQQKPLIEVTHEAITLLYQQLGVVNTIRFLNQFTNGYGNDTEESDILFGNKSLDELVTKIKRARKYTS